MWEERWTWLVKETKTHVVTQGLELESSSELEELESELNWTLPYSSPPSPPQMAMFGSSDWSVSQGVSIPPVPPLPGHDVWWSDQMTSTWLDYHNLKIFVGNKHHHHFFINQLFFNKYKQSTSSVIKQNLEYSVCKQHSSTAMCMRPTEARPVSFNWNV